MRDISYIIRLFLEQNYYVISVLSILLLIEEDILKSLVRSFVRCFRIRRFNIYCFNIKIPSRR